jgi:putative transposase
VAEGTAIGGKRVARLMRTARLVGASRRKAARTTIRDKREHPALDLVERRFTAAGPDQRWVADITYIPTWAGFLYLAVVVDVWSRRVVGWAMATHLRTELVLDALEMAARSAAPRMSFITRTRAANLGSTGRRNRSFPSLLHRM